MLKLGMKSKNCQLQSSRGASKSKLAKTGSLPEDGFCLHIKDKPEKCPAGDNSVRLATTWQAPEGQSSDLDEAQATQAVQEFVWSSKVKSGWLGTRSLQVGGLGAGGDEKKVEGKRSGSGGNQL